MIQKEILPILANKVRNIIREEIRDAKFCILVDEAKDTTNREQMAIVLRFVDVHNFLWERFFEIVHVTDITAFTLKKKISDVLARYNLNIKNMQGQGYDGASNIRGLALVAAAENDLSVWLFFSKLAYIVNFVSASPKRQNELQCAQAAEVEHMLVIGECETGRGANQIGTLHQARTIRWSSHFNFICNLIDMYGATIKVLQTMVEEGSSNSIRGKTGGALIAMRSFDFIFILHLMHRIMGITDLLCRALQHKFLDILNAINLILTTKALLQTLREDGFDTLLMHMGSVCAQYDIEIHRIMGITDLLCRVLQYKSLDILNAIDLVLTTKALLQTLRQDGFDILLMHMGSICTQYDIEMPMMDACYKEFAGRSCQQRDHIIMEHHYRVDIFNAVIDFQLGD
ncbi:uncharacterized protein LOC130795473 [Actinidia eriantha]|uniref:uncharacterized protein LOC130795473 n=1 Tax=Actinidia eriantha TaxID=165200 RepID=UPI002585517B|nr:uncharacterized protein LOC130795473 [Actinidia eriantha]